MKNHSAADNYELRVTGFRLLHRNTTLLTTNILYFSLESQA
jgi:hypothetical protein